MNYTPSTQQKLAIIRNNIEMFGLRRTLVDALVHLFRHRPDTFDAAHGVSTRLTAGSVLPLEASIGDPKSVENGHGYEPTDELVMRHILRFVEQRFSVPDLSFVDLGCGRGRALLMASELPFREVIGVELDPIHCAAARANVEAYRVQPMPRGSRAGKGGAIRSEVRVCCEDVTRFAFPATDLLVYMFNPFRGSVFRGVLDSLSAFQRETRRTVHVVLSNPTMEDMMLAHPAFERRHEFQVIAAGSSWNLWACTAAAANVRVAPEARAGS